MLIYINIYLVLSMQGYLGKIEIQLKDDYKKDPVNLLGNDAQSQ